MEAVADDRVWETIRSEVTDDVLAEPGLGGFLHNLVLRHGTLASSLSQLLATKLESPAVGSVVLRDLITESHEKQPGIVEAAIADLQAVVIRDPAARGYSQPFLYYKGFHAVQAYRVSHYYWTIDRHALALYLQNRISEVFGVDIHPGAHMGKGLMFDHATSIVIGETAVVDDDVSMLHEVTLGGTGKESGDRHPKIGRGVMLGAGAKLLGNITVGRGAKIGAGSVVLHDVPPHTTVAGIPAKPVSYPASAFPALDMDQSFNDEPLLKLPNIEDFPSMDEIADLYYPGT